MLELSCFHFFLQVSTLHLCTGGAIFTFFPPSLSLSSCLLLLIWSFLIIGGLPPGRMAMFDPILLMFLR